jgi:murein DD-endopeptidase MepM/ murein hydrolase activator NlpD
MENASGPINSNGFLDYPVDGYITSSYGMRLHPVYKRWTLHDGTDFGAPCGTPVYAAAKGTVLAVYYNAGYGNRVILDNGYTNGAGLGTAYTQQLHPCGEERSRGVIGNPASHSVPPALHGVRTAPP